MSKNKNKNKGEQTTERVATAPKIRKPRGPMAPLPERICEKAGKVLKIAQEIAKLTASRGAPQSVRDEAQSFVGLVQAWVSALTNLKDSGWEPTTATAKVAIVEGDLIKIIDEHLARYSYIDGLLEGRVQLVAGEVVQLNKMKVEVALKDTEGKFYGFAPRRYLTHR